MMNKTLVASLILFVLGAGAADARGRRGAHGIPPGHQPPPGLCRVWYEGVPPGHQPRPTDCRLARRQAAHDPYAAVVYGPRGHSSLRTHAHVRGQNPHWMRLAFEYGYQDGYAGARVDVERRAYDPRRHDGYRDGGRGYEKKHGSRARYRRLYREGFEAGYDEGYRDASHSRPRGGIAVEVYLPF